VQAAACALARRDPSMNVFQLIHAELHDRFGITSYEQIRREQYPAVMALLKERNLVPRLEEPQRFDLLGGE
jgi:hypothetical protein